MRFSSVKAHWPAGALVIAVALWSLSLSTVAPDDLGAYGMLSHLPITWYLAFATAIGCAIATALRAEPQRRDLWYFGSLAALILIIHATVSIKYDLPRYTWTFKHFGVVDYLHAHDRSPRHLDIYFNWPGFFAGADWLQRATGLPLETMAKWSPPVFEAMATASVLYMARSIGRDARVVALTPVLYLLVNWVGQDYFAPQAMSFALALIVIGAAIRLLSPGPLVEHPERRLQLLVVIVITWLGVITSHQLTPIMLLVSLGFLLLLHRRREYALAGVLIVTEIAWVALSLPYLQSSHYPLLSFDPLASSSTAVDVPAVHSLGFQLRAHSVTLLYFGLFAVGVLRGVLTFRRDIRNRTMLVLAVAPAVVLLAQSYGGEGKLRTYLFACPFLAYLVADALVTIPRERLRAVVAVAGVTLVSVCFLFAYYGQEQVNVVSHDDVAAIEWFYSHAPKGTGPLYLAPNAPTRLSKDYVDFPIADDALPTLLSDQTFARALTADNAVRAMRKYHESTYLIVSGSEGRYLEYFGIAPRQRYDSLIRELQREPALELLYKKGGSYIWRLRESAT